MNLPYRYICFICFALTTSNASAVGLIEAYQLARESDPTFKAAFYAREAGQQFKVLGRSNLLPTITANYSYNKNDVEIKYDTAQFTGTEQRDYASRTSSVQLRQPLINLDGYARYKQGLAQTSLSDQEFLIRNQELILRVFNKYAAMLYAADVLTLAKVKSAAYVEQRQANIVMFKMGEGTKTEILESQAKYDLAEAEIVDAQDALENARIDLSKTLGHEVNAIQPLLEDVEMLTIQPASLTEWETIAEQNNLELIAQRYTLDIAQEEVNRSQAGHMPRLDAIASWSQNDSDTINTFNQEATIRSVGLQLTLPIYSGGSVSALTQQSQSRLQKIQAEFDIRENAVIVELQKQFNAVLNAKRKLSALRTAVNSAQLLIEATKKSVSGGTRTNVDVLNAESQLFEAKRDISLARYTYLQNYLNLKKTAGILDLNDLQLVATNFQK